jgi:hypothetical protein
MIELSKTDNSIINEALVNFIDYEDFALKLYLENIIKTITQS